MRRFSCSLFCSSVNLIRLTSLRLLVTFDRVVRLIPGFCSGAPQMLSNGNALFSRSERKCISVFQPRYNSPFY
ncbi:hypothetical protein CCH79_00007908 [Gambusia affinis]|uniref:Secreted protein n=1 Tax=Gambusia affinis TaxID=33528 RepID=A0A315W1T4_GAMAF|nr:hypothetical protein CCH79_00007908 [Gambusia affinis]